MPLDTPTLDSDEWRRNDRDYSELSLQLAFELARLPPEIKSYLLSRDIRSTQFMLPEHREIVVRSLSDQAALDPNLLKDKGVSRLLPSDRAALVKEVVELLYEEGDRHRATLETAISAHDRDTLVRLCANNTFCTWHFAHVLAEFAIQHPEELEQMGMDPQHILADARSRDQSQWLAFLTGMDWASIQSPLQPARPAAAQPGNLADFAIGPVSPAPATAAPPSPPRPSAPMDLTPKGPEAPKPFIPRAYRAAEVIMGPARFTVANIQANMSRGAQVTEALTTPNLCKRYTQTLRASDAIETAIRDDDGNLVFDHPMGHIDNGISPRIADHPLAGVLRDARGYRIRIASILVNRPDAHFPERAHYERMMSDATAVPSSPAPAAGHYAIQAPVATPAPAGQQPASPPPVPTVAPPPPQQEQADAAPPRPAVDAGRPRSRRQQPAPTVAPARPRPARGSVSLVTWVCARQASIKGRIDKFHRFRKAARALKQKNPVLASTRQARSIGGTMTSLLKLVLYGSVCFVFVYGGRVVMERLRQHTWHEYASMAEDYIFGRPMVGDYVKRRDKAGVFVYLSAEQARVGNEYAAYQGLHLDGGQLYPVIETAGDVLRIVIRDLDNRRVAVWVDTNLVVRVRQ